MNKTRYTEPGGLPAGCLNLLDKLRASHRFSYRLHWTGSKIPRGASVKVNPEESVAIAWTQHGVVTGSDGQNLGYYERTEEWGGESGREHEMLIATDFEVVPAEGMTCELVRDFQLEVPSV